MKVRARQAFNADKDAISLLENGQYAIRQGFEQFDDLPDNNLLEKKKLVERIMAKLDRQMGIEANIFYPAVLAELQALNPVIQHSMAVSAQSQAIMSRIQKMHGDEQNFSATVHALAELSEQKTLHQQTAIFPTVKNSSVDIQALGRQIAQQQQAF